MALHLYGAEEDHEDVPLPSSLNRLHLEEKQVVVLIDVWMPPFRSEMKNQSVKKTLTIPQWLDDIAKDHKINYSSLLQKAIKEHLGVEKRL